MTAQVLLLRGINVGGKGRLPMADLRKALHDLDAQTAKTYIQSGNCVCDPAIDPAALADLIAQSHGFRPAVFALSSPDWHARIAPEPFPEAVPNQVHLFFTETDDTPALDVLHDIAAPSETLHATPGVLWLHAPDGIGRSKLAQSMERRLSRPLTARNLKTVAAITALLEETQ